MKFFYYNLFQNICRLFHVLIQFLFTIWETELDYYHQKVNVRVASRVAKELKIYDLGRLGNLKKMPEILGFDSECPAGYPKAKFWLFLVKNCKDSTQKHSIEKHTLPNFVRNFLRKQVFISNLVQTSWFYFFEDFRISKDLFPLQIDI